MSKILEGANLFFAKTTINTFFREIKVIGQENIPKDGPVIIFGNHNNQFIDALMMQATCGRKVNFIMAAASMRKPLHGALAKAMGCIPVERPRDIAKPGKGTIISAKDGILIGKDTEFTKECHKNTQILVKFIKDQLRVSEVISDTELHYTTETHEGNFENMNEKYKICPDIDQSQLFGQVWDALHKRKCIGIFPEGISHDSPDFMPLKAGICIMALGAMQQFRQKVYIVPCGLNYFTGHRFRSKVAIQYGQAFEIPFDLVDLYQNNKREAIQTLLFEIQNRLRAVVYRAQSNQELQAIVTAQYLYQHSFKRKLKKVEECILFNRFNSTYKSFHDHPEMVSLIDEIKQYNSVMSNLKLTDQETVADFSKGVFSAILGIAYSALYIIFLSIFAFPGLILNGPIGLVLRYLAEKARKKEASRWPSPCLDMVASFKISFGLVIVPVTFWLYYAVFFYVMKHFIFSENQKEILYTIQTLFIILYPVYAFFMLRLFDEIKKHLRAIRARVIFFSRNKELVEQEKDIEFKVREMVNIYCKANEENYNENKIISDEQQAEIDSAKLVRRERFIQRLKKVRQFFSQPIRKIALKLQKKRLSDETMQDVYRYLDNPIKNETEQEAS